MYLEIQIKRKYIMSEWEKWRCVNVCPYCKTPSFRFEYIIQMPSKKPVTLFVRKCGRTNYVWEQHKYRGKFVKSLKPPCDWLDVKRVDNTIVTQEEIEWVANMRKNRPGRIKKRRIPTCAIDKENEFSDEVSLSAISHEHDDIVSTFEMDVEEDDVEDEVEYELSADEEFE